MNKFYLLFTLALSLFNIQFLKAQKTHCELVLTNGGKYVGECIEGTIPHGYGKQTNPDNSYFIGTFQYRERIKGNYYWANGDSLINAIYEGDQLKKGTYYFVNGGRYQGPFKNDMFDGEGVYYYSPKSAKEKYVGAFANGKFNGYGILTYKNGNRDEGIWKDDLFQGSKIGEYQKNNVLKKGDTIITFNNKYLLSKQPFIGKGNKVYGFIPDNSFIVEKDISGNTNPIGYITTDGQLNSGLYGATAEYAKTSKGHKFFEIFCDKETYNKFLKFCDWQICKATNTANVFSLSFEEYNNVINEDIALNNKIAMLNLQDIITSITSDLMSDKTKYLFDLNTSLRDVIIRVFVNMVTEMKLTGQAGACMSTAINTVEKTLNQQYKDLLTITVDDYFNAKNQQIRDMYKTEFQKSVEDAYHTFFDLVDDCSPNTSKRLIIYKIMPEIVNAGMLLAANATIKFSLSPEYQKSLIADIERAKKKSIFLANLKYEFSKSMNSNNEGCLGYARIIYDLHFRCQHPYGQDYEQEQFQLMNDYVFGNKEVSPCNILNKQTLKVNNSTLTPEKKYDLKNAIRAKRGNKTRFYIFEDGKCIGWVDDENERKTFRPNAGIIEGLNLFGSIYIGPNNPLNPDGTPNYDLPPQDGVDLAALKHDKCYDSKRAQGNTDALFNTGVSDCDKNLASACSLYMPDNYSFKSATENLLMSLIKWNYDPDIRTRATLVATAFSALYLKKKVLDTPMENSFEKILINDHTYKFSKAISIPSISDVCYNVEEGDFYKDNETKFQGGKIVSGIIYDRNGEVKYKIIPKRNH
jgi:hypothetical protein